MTIHLPEELQTFIRAKVRSGEFASEDDAVAEAIRRLRQSEEKLPRIETDTPATPSLRDPVLGSMRDAADEMDEIVAEAMKLRHDEPWREFDFE